MGPLKIHGALTALVLFSTAAGADTLEILGPAGEVQPEGFTVALLRRDAQGAPAPVAAGDLEVKGASARPAPPRPPLKTFLIVPDPGAREVSIRGRDGALTVERTFKLGPPAAKLSLALTGKAPVKGRDTTTAIDIRVLKEDGSVDAESPPPVLRANVGVIENPPTAVAPGHFRATYTLPETRYPEVAVIVAFAPWPHPGAIHGAVGSLLVPLASSIDLPGRTERNAQMSIEIAGTSYGPVTAGADGRFQLPVIVPPGHRFGRGKAVDRAGNRRSSKIDLMLPPTDQLACVMNPDQLPADGVSRARVVCAATDTYGRPQRSGLIDLKLPAGSRSDRRVLAEGLYEWIYTAPAQLRDEPVVLSAQYRDGRNLSREELEVTLRQGPADKLTASLSAPIVHYGGAATVTAQVGDPQGRPRDGATVAVRAPFGEVGAVTARGKGRYEVQWLPPETGDAPSATLSVRSFGPQGSAPARISAWWERDRVFVGVTDLVGWPVPDQPVRVGEREVRTGPDGAVDVGALEPGTWSIRHARWPGISLTLHVISPGFVWPEGARTGSPEVELPVRLGPAIPVIVEVRVRGREVTYWAEDARGQVLPDRKLALHVEGGEWKPRGSEGGRTTVTLSGGQRVQVSVADLATGVTRLAEVPPP